MAEKNRRFYLGNKTNYLEYVKATGAVALVVAGVTVMSALDTAVSFPIAPGLTAKPSISIDDAVNNAVTDVLTLEHTTSGSPAAGIGAGIQFKIEDAGGSEEQARIDAVIRVATDAAEDVDLIFKTNVAGTIKTMMSIVADETGSGGAKLVQIGADANAVSLDIHPATTAKGTLRISAADSAGDTVTTITNASQAAARTYTIPDAGASASFVMTEGAATVNGIKTFGSMFRIPYNGSVAAAGSVQGDAAALSEGLSVVTGANGTLGVRLPTAVAGAIVIIKGTTNGVLKVWPATGAAINGLGSDNAMSFASGLIPAILIAISATQWYTFPLLPS